MPRCRSVALDTNLPNVASRNHSPLMPAALMMDRAKERAGPEDVGDQALMRGLDTALPFVRPGLSLSGIGRRSCDRPRRTLGSSLAVVPPSLLHDCCLAGFPFFVGCNAGDCRPVEPVMLERSTAPDHVTPIDLPMTSRLIAQADSSRAIGSSRYRRGAGARLRRGSPRDRLGRRRGFCAAHVGLRRCASILVN